MHANAAIEAFGPTTAIRLLSSHINITGNYLNDNTVGINFASEIVYATGRPQVNAKTTTLPQTPSRIVILLYNFIPVKTTISTTTTSSTTTILSETQVSSTTTPVNLQLMCGMTATAQVTSGMITSQGTPMPPNPAPQV